MLARKLHPSPKIGQEAGNRITQGPHEKGTTVPYPYVGQQLTKVGQLARYIKSFNLMYYMPRGIHLIMQICLCRLVGHKNRSNDSQSHKLQFHILHVWVHALDHAVLLQSVLAYKPGTSCKEEIISRRPREHHGQLVIHYWNLLTSADHQWSRKD